MPDIHVVLLPSMLTDAHLLGHAVVVFDVLRATTTMAAAMNSGISEIRVFGSIDAAKAAAMQFAGPRILAGEHNCLPPAGFDLGNSPGDYTAERCAGRTMFFSTTNGTRALVAAARADHLLAGAIVNATATAKLLLSLDLPITLLCSGTSGQISLEDTLGCGAVINAIAKQSSIQLQNDEAHIAHNAFLQAQNKLPETLKHSLGGKNIHAAGLDTDITFAARLDAIQTAIRVNQSAGNLVATKGG